MSALKACGMVGVMMVLSVAARAADMPPIIQQAPLAVEEFGSGWYLRGDIGYRINRPSNIWWWGGDTVFDGPIENNVTVGGGIGLKSRWLRADVTVDYGTRANFQATVPGDHSISVKVGAS